MKKIFIYYSLSNNGDTVADYLKEKGCEIRKIAPKYKYPKNMFLRILIGGYKATFNKKDKLVDFDTNLTNYDKIIIGSPIWNDRLSSPINSIINLLDLKNKELDFILYSASGKANKASKKIKTVFNKEPIILKEPKINKKELEKLNNI